MNRTIVIATDTWEPQINGVVRTLKRTVDTLCSWGHHVEVIHPYLFRPIRIPGFNDLELTHGLNRPRINRMLRGFEPGAIHVATEGPLGLAVRRYCTHNRVPFTTWHHTDFPATLPRHLPISQRIIYGYMRWFHRHSSTIMVNTPRMRDKLLAHGFTQPMRVWSGGVDTDLFRPRPKTPRSRPVALYVGRIVKEKNLEKFLECAGDYDKVLVGDGAARADLERRYPQSRFVGVLSGEPLARAYADADVFVFPSITDTFGLVLIEALACGVPVAAYPVQGPADILQGDGVGCLSSNLGAAIDRALADHDPQRCRDLALQYSWQNSARQFVSNLAYVQPADSLDEAEPHILPAFGAEKQQAGKRRAA
ncbi:MAG TPA: glycosyltransferase family 1 protein [Pirellulales bacterium]|nr:glycosyltransferase family 1 protein [Pirellulales bacterium]